MVFALVQTAQANAAREMPLPLVLESWAWFVLGKSACAALTFQLERHESIAVF
jgi:hypothetical protein